MYLDTKIDLQTQSRKNYIKTVNSGAYTLQDKILGNLSSSACAPENCFLYEILQKKVYLPPSVSKYIYSLWIGIIHIF